MSLFVTVLANEDDISEDDFSESDEDENEEFSSDEENVGMPEHKFEVKETKFVSGKKKGQSKTQVKLLIPPNTFTRRKIQIASIKVHRIMNPEFG